MTFTIHTLRLQHVFFFCPRNHIQNVRIRESEDGCCWQTWLHTTSQRVLREEPADITRLESGVSIGDEDISFTCDGRELSLLKRWSKHFIIIAVCVNPWLHHLPRCNHHSPCSHHAWHTQTTHLLCVGSALLQMFLIVLPAVSQIFSSVFFPPLSDTTTSKTPINSCVWIQCFCPYFLKHWTLNWRPLMYEWVNVRHHELLSGTSLW